MSNIDIARRVHDHNYRFDPYVRSLLDTDFYKILMAYFVWKNHKDVDVTFTVKNRSKNVRIRDFMTIDELNEQLEYVWTMGFTNSELIWLKGNTFYGQEGIFTGDFIEALRNLKLPLWRISTDGDDYQISFTGSWFEVMLWEIYALAIINEAKSRHAMKGMSAYELRVLYANATTKIVSKLKLLRENKVPRIAEFGTRRRHGFLWQQFVVEAMQEELGDSFLGTSNALIAFRNDLEAIGTNAHELPMVAAALSRLRSPEAEQRVNLYTSQYDVLRRWQETFSGHLLVALPDTFGTTQFLMGAKKQFPQIANWRGFREDSKDPFIGGEEKIAFWKSIGQDPRSKLQLFSDGLDAEQMIALNKAFGGRIEDGYGWGTLATNDLRGCDPRDGDALNPISLVCKVTEVKCHQTGNSIGAVKLSDNYLKAMGPEAEVSFYRNTFGTAGMADAPVIV